MTKLKQFSNKFDVIDSRKNNLVISLMSMIQGKIIHELEANSASPAAEPSSHRLLRKSTFYRMLDVETGHDWPGSRGFVEKASSSYFLS